MGLEFLGVWKLVWIFLSVPHSLAFLFVTGWLPGLHTSPSLRVGLFTGLLWSLLWNSAWLVFCSRLVSWYHLFSLPWLFVQQAPVEFVQSDSCLILHLFWLVPFTVLFSLVPCLLTCEPLSKQCRYVVLFYWPLIFNRRCNLRQQNNLDINLGLSEQQMY